MSGVGGNPSALKSKWNVFSNAKSTECRTTYIATRNSQSNSRVSWI